MSSGKIEARINYFLERDGRAPAQEVRVRIILSIAVAKVTKITRV